MLVFLVDTSELFDCPRMDDPINLVLKPLCPATSLLPLDQDIQVKQESKNSERASGD